MKLIKKYKRIYISISGFVDLTDIATKIVDTQEFQRLRYLHQLGTAYLIYPSANHSRFEHSIGTYNLADRLLRTIKDTTSKHDIRLWMKDIPELQEYYSFKTDDDYLDDWICELIKIAALCHDLGHGPFSHTFDEYLHSIGNRSRHEDRSKSIIKKITREFLSDNEIRFVQNIIDPSEHHRGFVYQIVANKLNSIDVDKMDYINRDNYSVGFKSSFDTSPLIDDVRVIDNNICYPIQLAYHISDLFILRYRLHKQICSHKTVVGTQMMIYDLLKKIESKNILEFSDMTDHVILSIPKILGLKEANAVLNRIEKRDFYKLTDSRVFQTKEERDSYLKKIHIDEKTHIIHKGEIGMFPKDIKDPFGHIYFYDRKDTKTKFTLDKDSISGILPDHFTEYYVYVYKI